MSAGKVYVYWVGIIGIPGKGPNYQEDYHPERTIGEITATMQSYGLGERNKTIRILKCKGSINNYDRNDPYWSPSAKMSELVAWFGGMNFGRDIQLIYVIV